MHFWPNKSITRAEKVWSPAVNLSKRPKGTTEEEWKAYVKSFKYEKHVVLDTVPKTSLKRNPKQQDKE